MSQLLHQHHTEGSLVWAVLKILADNQLLLLSSKLHNIDSWHWSSLNPTSWSPWCFVVGPLVGQSEEDDTFKQKDILIVTWGIVESLGSRECLTAFYGRLSTEGGWVDGSTHTRITDMVTNDYIQQHVVGALIMMGKRTILAVEMLKRLGPSLSHHGVFIGTIDTDPFSIYIGTVQC